MVLNICVDTYIYHLKLYPPPLRNNRDPKLQDQDLPQLGAKAQDQQKIVRDIDEDQVVLQVPVTKRPMLAQVLAISSSAVVSAVEKLFSNFFLI